MRARPASSTPSASRCTATSPVTAAAPSGCGPTRPPPGSRPRSSSRRPWPAAGSGSPGPRRGSAPSCAAPGSPPSRRPWSSPSASTGPGRRSRRGSTRAATSIGELVGLNLDQFCQVALLPQGRFQAFLRARSEDRHKLLQQLFRTGRFEGVERWLREHRLALRAVLRHARGHRVGPGEPAERGSRGRPPGARGPARPRGARRDRSRSGRTALVAAAAAERDRAARELEVADLGGGHRRSGARGRAAARRPTGPPCRRTRRAVPARPGGDRLPALRRRARRLGAGDPGAAGRRARRGRADPGDRDPGGGGGRRSRPCRAGRRPGRRLPAGDPRRRARRRLPRPRPCCPASERLVGLRRQVETYAARIAQLDSELVAHETTLARLPERLERCRTDHRAAAAAVGGAARRRVGPRGPAQAGRPPRPSTPRSCPSWPRPAPPRRRRSTRRSS